MTTRRPLGELLHAAGVISEEQLQAALMEQRRWGGLLGEVLIGMGAVSEEVLVATLSKQFRVRSVDVRNVKVAKEILALVPGELAFESRILPLRSDGRFLDLAMVDPLNQGVIEEVRIRTRLNVRPLIAGPRALGAALERHYSQRVGGVAMGYGMTAGSRVLEPTTDGIGLRATSSAEADEYRKQVRPNSDVELPEPNRNLEHQVQVLQQRVHQLEALLARDEDVLRKLMGLMVEKGLVSREDIISRLR